MVNRGKKSSITYAIVIIMILSVCSKMFGFIREMFIANYFGMNNQTDAYFTALNIPSILNILLGTCVSTAFIPIYSSVLADDEQDGIEMTSSSKFANNVINISVLFSIIIAITGIIFAPFVVKIFAPDYDEVRFNLTIQYVRYLFPILPFIVIYGVFISILSVHKKFIITQLAALPFNLIIIVSTTLFYKQLGIKATVYGTILATLIQAIIVVPYMKGYHKYKFVIDLKDKNFKMLFILAAPMIIASAINEINEVVSSIVSSSLDKGSISALNYSYRIKDAIISVFVTSIILVIFPTLSKLVAEKKFDEFKSTVSKYIIIMIMLLAPIVIFSTILSKKIIIVLFQRGEFTDFDTRRTAPIFAIQILTILAFGVRDLTTRAFYSIKDFRTPVINGFIAILSNFILAIIFVKTMDINGIALASTISAYLSCLLMLIALNKKLSSLRLFDKIIDFTKLCLSLIACGLSVFFSKLMLSGLNNMVIIMVSIITGMIIYLTCLWLSKNTIFIEIVKIVKVKLKFRSHIDVN